MGGVLALLQSTKTTDRRMWLESTYLILAELLEYNNHLLTLEPTDIKSGLLLKLLQGSMPSAQGSVDTWADKLMPKILGITSLL